MADRSRSPAGRLSASWATSAGAGERDGAFLGLTGPAGEAVAFAGAIGLMALCPAIVILVYIINRHFDGSISTFCFDYLGQAGVRGVFKLWPALLSAEARQAWACFACFGALQAALQLGVPGKRFHGPVSPMGNVPQYKANGVQCFILTGALFFAAVRAKLIHPANLYDIFGELLGVCNTVALALCVYLTWKGLNKPSTSDCGSNGKLVYDFYWGTELYPRIGKLFDIKTWTNCRMGMMSWTFIVICFVFKQLELTGHVSNSMLVSVLLQAAYCYKFFLWETGYWKTMDIAHDRAGYYLCWGCLNWVPGVYTSQALYLVRHPHDLPAQAAVAIAVVGLALIYINWEADDQRQRVRETGGKCTIWGRKPKCIQAKYTAIDGEEKTSLLLASGWWGFARHMHYVPEILASVCWTLPAGFSHVMPWFYVIYLTILLLDRLYRDQARCRSKYGADWDRYCAAVPYMILPGIL